MKTYTDHKLTDSMLRQLSRASKGGQPTGMSSRALQARGLVQSRMVSLRERLVITDAGRAALTLARAQGW